MHLLLCLPRIYAMIHANMGSSIRSLWIITWHPLVVWCLMVPACAVALYAILTPALRRAARRKIPRVAEAA